MSDSKKPKLSEIQAREQRVPWTVEAIAAFHNHSKTDIPYLLDLVERLGKSISGYIATHAHDFVPIEQSDCTCPACIEAGALLEELEL